MNFLQLTLIIIQMCAVFSTTTALYAREEAGIGSSGLVLEEEEDFSYNKKTLKRTATYRPQAVTLNKKGRELFLRGEFFNKTGTYDVNGSLVEDTNTANDTYSEMDGIAGINYGLTDRFEIDSELRFRNNSSETSRGSASNSGLESLLMRVVFGFGAEKDFYYGMTAGFRQTFYSPNEYASGQTTPADELVLGEGGVDLTFGGLFSYHVSPHTWFSTEVSYWRRPAHISPELRYNAHLAWPYSKIAFLLGMDGIYSMGQDEFTNDTNKKPPRATGATSRYNSINRSEVAPYIGMNIGIKNMRLDFKYSQVVAGSSTDQGSTYMVALVFGQEGITSDDRKVAKFKEYHVEASISKVSPRGKFCKIDQGLDGDVEKGMKIDFFKTDFFGGNILVASGDVYEVGPDWAIVRILQHFRPEIDLTVGLTARGY